MKNTNDIDYAHIFEQIAANNNTTPEQVRRDIEEAIRMARQSEDPAVRAKWESLMPGEAAPSAEEFLATILRYI